MVIQRAAKNDKKYVKGNNSKTVDFDAKQEKRRELAERMKRSPAMPAKETAEKPKRNKNSCGESRPGDASGLCGNPIRAGSAELCSYVSGPALWSDCNSDNPPRKTRSGKEK